MKINSLTKLFKVALVSAALVTTVVACGNKNKDNPNLNAYQQSCSNCGDITGFPFFATTSTVQSMSYYGSNAMKIQWSFSGQNVNPNQPQPQQQQPQSNPSYPGYPSYPSYSNSAPSMLYNGKVSAIGTVTVNSLLNLGLCPQIPAGQYQLSTQNVGTWNGTGYQAQLSGIRLLITRDNISFTAILTNAVAEEYLGYSSYGSTRVRANLQVEQVNGYYCQGANFYLY